MNTRFLFEKSVWSIVLAAGASERFGSVKALARPPETSQANLQVNSPVNSGPKTMLEIAVEKAREISGANYMVVLGAYAEAILAASPWLQRHNTTFNTAWKNGMGSSIAAGTLEVLRSGSRVSSVLILPVDQPYVSVAHLQALEGESQKRNQIGLTSNKSSSQSNSNNAGGVSIGPPAAVPAYYFPLLTRLHGPQGLKSVIGPDDFFVIPDNLSFRDVDRPNEFLPELGSF